MQTLLTIGAIFCLGLVFGGILAIILMDGD